MLILHAALFKVKLLRLVWFQRLVNDLRNAHREDLPIDSLLPYMRKRDLAAGETLVRKGEKADRLYYLSEGELELTDFAKTLHSGAICMTTVTLEIHPLSPARLADFMAFFEGEAFSDNQKWSFCYCQCFYEDHRKVHWAIRTAAENRACASRRITQGRMQGLLAYHEGQVVGWCNAAPRELLHALDAEPIANPEYVGTILCFLIAPSARGRGVATALLNTACQHLRAQGLLSVEANPRPSAKGTAENHFGPLSMYLKAGFTVRRTDADGSVWVAKELGPRPSIANNGAHRQHYLCRALSLID